MGSAADLLRAGAGRSSDTLSRGCAGWPKNPRALAGRLRRAQTFLRALGIEVAFGREGRAGTRVIRMHTTLANPIGTVSAVRHSGPRSGSGDVEGNRLDNTVSTVGRVSENGDGAGPTSPPLGRAL
jgi:hypothetical protein